MMHVNLRDRGVHPRSESAPTTTRAPPSRGRVRTDGGRPTGSRAPSSGGTDREPSILVTLELNLFTRASPPDSTLSDGEAVAARGALQPSRRGGGGNPLSRRLVLPPHLGLAPGRHQEGLRRPHARLVSRDAIPTLRRVGVPYLTSDEAVGRTSRRRHRVKKPIGQREGTAKSWGGTRLGTPRRLQSELSRPYRTSPRRPVTRSPRSIWTTFATNISRQAPANPCATNGRPRARTRRSDAETACRGRAAPRERDGGNDR